MKWYQLKASTAEINIKVWISEVETWWSCVDPCLLRASVRVET